MQGVIAVKEKRTSIVPIAVLILCCLAFLLLSYLSCDRIDKMASALVGDQLPTIVIDPGHGGEDGGASGKNTMLEKDVNLAVATNLQKLFEASGYHVVMTRTTDVSINDEGLGTIRERKVSDLHNRLKLLESQGDCIFISVHQNYFEQSQYYGTQVFYSTKNPASKEIAESIKSRVVSLLQPENKRETKPADRSIYLLWNAKVPAVLVECGFLSNPPEAAKLKDPAYQQKMAFAIYCGMQDYIHETYGSGTL
ncbi:MAG: N-acetylmuramoyl-L-alanine amidase [Ruminococcaceae bacterium]|nr:N-acetylmuramoyl-L-alanine amidase [Oscillospiraceae bacterium]